jgi:hypothetical protein
MDLINEAIASIELREPGDKLVYLGYAELLRMNRVTLAQRHQGCQGPRTTQYLNQKKLTP